MLWYHKKIRKQKLKKVMMNKTRYDELKKSGELKRMFPKATGDFDDDCNYVFLEERRRLGKDGEEEVNGRWVNPYDIVFKDET